jgi:hypothetical protein
MPSSTPWSVGDAPATGTVARWFRRTGADLPFGDPLPSHGLEMEGWFWRFTDVERGRVAVALCGVNRHPEGPWATVAVALHPGGVVRHACVPVADAATDRFAVRAGPAGDPVLEADRTGVRVALEDVALEADLTAAARWPRRLLHGSGLVSVVPFLGQYWHPHVLGGAVTGTVRCEGEAARSAASAGWSLAGARPYAERNWGTGFPSRWWWGQAQAFADADTCVAFAGGHLTVAGTAWGADIGGVVVRRADAVLRLTPPTALVRTGVSGGRWWVSATSARWSVEVEGRPEADAAAVLPVPVPAERRNVLADHEHLAGRLVVTVRRRRRPGASWQPWFAGTSPLAALEVGSLDPSRSYNELVGLAGEGRR